MNQVNSLIERGLEEQRRSDEVDENRIARIEYIRGSNVLAEVQKAVDNANKCHQEDVYFEAFDDTKKMFLREVENRPTIVINFK